MPAAAGGAVWRVRAGVLLRAHRGKRAGRLQPVRPRRPRLEAGAPPGLAGRREAAVRRSGTAPSPPAVAARGPAAASRKAEPRNVDGADAHPSAPSNRQPQLRPRSLPDPDLHPAVLGFLPAVARVALVLAPAECLEDRKRLG